MLLPLVVGLFVPCIASANPATGVNVQPPTKKVGIGDNFTVDIFVNPDTAIAGAQFSLSFNASVLKANSVAEGNLLTQGGASTYFQAGTINNVAGTITGVAGYIKTAAPVSQNGTFATVSFNATAAGTSALHLSNVIVVNVSGQAVDKEVTDGNVTVYPDWDVNFDGKVSLSDLVLVGQCFGEMGAPHWIREDVNRDGEIDIVDMSQIVQHWTG
jgi:hypothetical protein